MYNIHGEMQGEKVIVGRIMAGLSYQIEMWTAGIEIVSF
jgi:hypothetical protein